MYALDAVSHSQAACHSETQAAIEDYFQAMTDEEINQAIARHCGIKLFEESDDQGMPVTVLTEFNIPKYTKDLNEMHMVEQTLTEAQKSVYGETLCAIIKNQIISWGYYPGDEEIDWNAVCDLIFATARQRAEAFLRTVGKWKE